MAGKFDKWQTKQWSGWDSPPEEILPEDNEDNAPAPVAAVHPNHNDFDKGVVLFSPEPMHHAYKPLNPAWFVAAGVSLGAVPVWPKRHTLYHEFGADSPVNYLARIVLSIAELVAWPPCFKLGLSHHVIHHDNASISVPTAQNMLDGWAMSHARYRLTHRNYLIFCTRMWDERLSPRVALMTALRDTDLFSVGVNGDED